MTAGPSPSPRALGLDLGEARIGVALADGLGLLAHPYETIDAKRGRPAERLREIVAREQVGVVVIGLPRNMDGREGPAAEKARAFAARLRAVLPGACEIRWVDERLTTVAAQKALHASGRDVRRSRPLIDQVAAQLILQTYLDQIALRG